MSSHCPRCGSAPPFTPIGCARCGLPFSGQVPAAGPTLPAQNPYAAQSPPPHNPYATQQMTYGYQPPAWSQPPGWAQPGYPMGYGYPQQPRPRDRTVEALLPVNRSGLAIAAGYLALFSILVLPAPFALGFGIAAMRDLRKRPDVGGRGRAVFGIVVGGFVTGWLVLAVIMGQLQS